MSQKNKRYQTPMIAASKEQTDADREAVHACDRLARNTLVVGVLLTSMAATILGLIFLNGDHAAAIDSPPVIGVDPNSATWGELALLPGLGESVSQKIIEYRESRRAELEPGELVFKTEADLLPVNGIGPKTLRRISPYLRLTPD